MLAGERERDADACGHGTLSVARPAARDRDQRLFRAGASQLQSHRVHRLQARGINAPCEIDQRRPEHVPGEHRHDVRPEELLHLLAPAYALVERVAEQGEDDAEREADHAREGQRPHRVR